MKFLANPVEQLLSMTAQGFRELSDSLPSSPQSQASSVHAQRDFLGRLQINNLPGFAPGGLGEALIPGSFISSHAESSLSTLLWPSSIQNMPGSDLASAIAQHSFG